MLQESLDHSILKDTTCQSIYPVLSSHWVKKTTLVYYNGYGKFATVNPGHPDSDNLKIM